MNFLTFLELRVGLLFLINILSYYLDFDDSIKFLLVLSPIGMSIHTSPFTKIPILSQNEESLMVTEINQ